MSRFERWSIWVTAALTAVTGIGLFWAKYLLESTDPWSVVNHPLQPWLLKAHIVVAPLFVFALGLVAVRHIWEHFQAGLRRGRWTGIITVAVTVPMILSGYLVQVITHPGWLAGAAAVHIGAGVLFVAGLAVHQLAVRQRRRATGNVCTRTAGIIPNAGLPPAR